MLLEKTSFVSVADAAGIIGCTVGRIRQLLAEGRIKGQKLNERAWAVDSRSAREYAKSDRTPGPKSSAN